MCSEKECPYMTKEECEKIREKRDTRCELMDDRLKEAERTTKSINKVFWLMLSTAIPYIVTNLLMNLL